MTINGWEMMIPLAFFAGVGYKLKTSYSLVFSLAYVVNQITLNSQISTLSMNDKEHKPSTAAVCGPIELIYFAA
jgi:hypothetical protein